LVPFTTFDSGNANNCVPNRTVPYRTTQWKRAISVLSSKFNVSSALSLSQNKSDTTPTRLRGYLYNVWDGLNEYHGKYK